VAGTDGRGAVRAVMERTAGTVREVTVSGLEDSELETVATAFPQLRRRELPPELTADNLLEQLALLGADLGDDGEALLRRVAADAPDTLEPAVEGLLTGRGLASHSTELLVDLVEAYYIDEPDDEDGYRGMDDDGISDHQYLGFNVRLSAHYRGRFLAMFRGDLPAGVACLNRLLNHATRARVQIL
jgi:hypothetical protein